MTDLPRYHKGSLGPLDFQTINEAFRRLDALRPLIESAAIMQPGGIPSAAPTVVRATKIPNSELPEGVPQNVPLYEWEQLFVAGDDLEGPNRIIDPDDDSYEAVRATSVYRSGPLSVDSVKLEQDDPLPVGYGVSIDENFREGICILLDYRRTDSTRVHLLLPIQQSARSFLAQIQGPGLTETFSLGDCLEGENFVSGEFKAYLHTAKALLTIPSNATTPQFCLGPEFVLIDVSRQNINPPGSPPATYYPSSLNAGNVVPVHAATFAAGTYYFTGYLPRLDAECPEPDPLTQPRVIREVDEPTEDVRIDPSTTDFDTLPSNRGGYL